MRPPDAIVPELTPAPSRAFDTPPEAPRNCPACGSYHGSVNAEINCLKAAVLRLRAALNTQGEWFARCLDGACCLVPERAAAPIVVPSSAPPCTCPTLSANGERLRNPVCPVHGVRKAKAAKRGSK